MSANVPDKITARVRRGAALLDKKVGPGWRGMIDLHILDIETRDDCVLGQLFGQYEVGLAFLDLVTPDDHGFSAGGLFSFATPWTNLMYHELNKAWKKELVH